MTCERCLLPIKKKKDHGHLICPLEPRSGRSEPTGNAWTRSAKAELGAHAKDVLQPKNKDGTFNKHFVQAHGTVTLQKQFKVSDREIRENADKYG